MEVTLSPESIEALAEAIASKLVRPKVEPLVDIKELSKAIGTPVGTLYHWVNKAKQNKMPFAKKGLKLMFKVSEVQEWMFSKGKAA